MPYMAAILGIMLFFAEIPYLAGALAAAIALLLAYLYYKRRKPWWRGVIVRAADYHRYHLAAIRNDPAVDAVSRDIAYQMLMVVEHQFKTDLRGSPGFAGIVKAHLGEKSTLASLSEIFLKLYREKAFTGYGDTDERLERLFNTMMSMVYRYHMMTSVVFSVVALLYMDLVLLLSLIRLDNRGSSRLFRDLAMNRM